MRRFFCLVVSFYMVIAILPSAVCAPIKWVDFNIPYESLKYAMNVDIKTAEQEKHISWITILAVAACRTGGKCDLSAVVKAAKDLESDQSPEEILGDLAHHYPYYHEAYTAVLAGFLGNFSIEKDGKWVSAYGLKAFSPIAEGFAYTHYNDFGSARTFGYKRKHLGNDLLGSAGTPIIAVESGTIEALGWNRYGGWRIGIRSFDHKRYYYYAHLQKDAPFALGLSVGQTVTAGDVIGFMGRTGYSDTENTNNIDINHLHFGMQLIFDESQKDCNSEIWINVYEINRLLAHHTSSVVKTSNVWKRVWCFRDLDNPDALTHSEQ